MNAIRCADSLPLAFPLLPYSSGNDRIDHTPFYVNIYAGRVLNEWSSQVSLLNMI
ncbi:MAG TPA: hypothetical protein VLA19_19090 [Herpetosiphonaceae bacterium]|nr:hypothetical protein [Herpetosiphonaceae bacterium]